MKDKIKKYYDDAAAFLAGKIAAAKWYYKATKDLVKKYYKSPVSFITDIVDLTWHSLHRMINKALTQTIWFIGMLLDLICAIGMGVLIFKLLALTTMPIGLVWVIAICMPVPLLGNMGYGHALGWCAALLCLYSFILAGTALIPAVIAAIALGFLAEAMFYGAQAFFEIETSRHDIEKRNDSFELIGTHRGKLKHMLAQTLGLAVMFLVFKLTAAAIIAAVAPYAVAILSAIGLGMGALFFTQEAYNLDTFNSNFIIKYVTNIIGKDSINEMNKSQLQKSYATAALVAIATFATLAFFPITLAGAPALIAALVAFSSGIATQQTIIALPQLATKIRTVIRPAKTAEVDSTQKSKPEESSTFRQTSKPAPQNISADESISLGKLCRFALSMVRKAF